METLDTTGRVFHSGEIVQHFKRETVSKQDNDSSVSKYLYRIIGEAYDADTGEHEMVYQACYDDKKIYTRNYDEFVGLVDKTKYPNIKQKYRFESVCTV